LVAIGVASLVGMVGAFKESQKLIAVPSVEDGFLNAPVTNYYNNPNQNLFQFTGWLLMMSASIGFSGACSLTIKLNKTSVRQTPHKPSSQTQVQQRQTEVFAADSPILRDDVWTDPWNEDPFKDPFNETETKNFETSAEITDTDTDWTFQTQSQEQLDHPSLDYKNWPDELAMLIYGEQGGGKTSKLLWLAEEHLKRGNIVIILSDFAYPGWIKGVEVAGVNGDFNAISQALNAVCNEGEARKQFRGVYGSTGYFAHDLPTVVLIADEVTSWSEQPAIELALRRLARLILQDLRQSNLKVYLGGHGRTLKTLFGQALAGKKETFDNQFIQVQCKAKSDPKIENGKRCAGQVFVNYFQGKEQESKLVKIPPLLPGSECSKKITYTTPRGEESAKVVYDFSKYHAVPFSKYHAEENQRRQGLKNLA